MHDILQVIVHAIQKNKRVVLNIISKSGTTTETIANYEVLLSVLEWYGRPQSESVVITSDRGSALWKYAEKHYIPRLEIPKFVGGRYSVFSPVGLFPLAVAGIDIKALCRGAAKMTAVALSPIKNNFPAQSATDLYYHYKNGKNIAETFVFGTNLESLGKWYRQLLGESTGKQFSLSKKEIWNGITPTVAIGSTDLHSMAQLYLGGPRDKFMMFILPEFATSPKLPNSEEFNALVPGIQKKSLQKIMEAISEGFIQSLQKQGRPYNILAFKQCPEAIGAIMQFKMFETLYLAHLMNVNPFDQPNVEEYKVITKKLLKSSK
jgi:glucose-6-phosphate isomerase